MDSSQGKQLKQKLKANNIIYGTYIPGKLQAMSSNFYPLDPTNITQIQEIVQFLRPDRIYFLDDDLVDSFSVALKNSNLHEIIELAIDID